VVLVVSADTRKPIDNEVDAAIAAICEAARTGQIGDGKIFISSLEGVVRIRTGETGTDAI
jgi:nitrogen regulatory protein P-II 1